MNKPPKEILNAVLSNLRDHPDDWSIGEYWARNHRIGAAIWLANRYYGTELDINGHTWGGVTLAASFFGWTMRWRRQLIEGVHQAVATQLMKRAAQ